MAASSSTVIGGRPRCGPAAGPRREPSASPSRFDDAVERRGEEPLAQEDRDREAERRADREPEDRGVERAEDRRQDAELVRGSRPRSCPSRSSRRKRGSRERPPRRCPTRRTTTSADGHPGDDERSRCESRDRIPARRPTGDGRSGLRRRMRQSPRLDGHAEDFVVACTWVAITRSGRPPSGPW